ncbi:hypothetical protein V8E55_007997 [Tylopilus felleus]
MPSTDNSLESRSTRSRSLGGTRSVRGIVDPANSVPGGKGKGKANPRSTPRTMWTQEETDNLKKDVFHRIAGELNGKFPSHMIWSKIKAEYTLISGIRSASGFYYDDSKGALVDDYTQAAWSIFFKSHPGASKYKNNPWPYWDNVALLVPNIAKGTHVLHPGQAKSKQGQKKITGPTDSDTIAAPPTTFTAVVDPGASQSMATTSANLDMQMTPPPPDATSSRVPNPNSIPPSTPSSYLPPPSTASVGSAKSGKLQVPPAQLLYHKH